MEINTASERALDYLKQLTGEIQQNGTGRLPSVKNLAHGAGVSHGTMWKAMQDLQRRGVLVILPGGGSVLTGRINQDLTIKPDSSIRSNKAFHISTIIRKEIVSFRYEPGEMLPTLKELSNQFGTTYRVCKSALENLVQGNLIKHHKRGYRVNEFVERSVRATIVFLGKGNTISDFVRTTERSVDFWIALANECRRGNISIKIVNTNYTRSDGNLLRSIRAVENSTIVLGYFLWSLPYTQDELENIVSILVPLNKRIAILEEGVYRARNIERNMSPLIHLFSLAYNKECAREISFHLLGLRHTDVVYFTIVNDEWDQNRMNGVIETFSSSGTGQVHVIKSDLEDIGAAMLKNRSFAQLRDTLIHFDMSGDKQTSSGVDFYDYYAYRYMEKQFLKTHFKPFFERALTFTSSTAWICATDSLAVAAIEFLRTKGISVPKEISVAGIDDSVEALGTGLTSYNFNVPGVVHAIVSYLLGDTPIASVSNRKSEIPGYISERESTGPARR